MLFLVAFGALAFGGFLIVLIARYGKHPQPYPVGAVIAGGASIPYDEFRALIIDLFEKLGIDIVHFSGSGNELDLIARTRTALTAGKYIVHSYLAPPGDRVTQAQVLRLQEQVKGEGASKGILMTPYAIERSGLGNLEVEIEFVDGKRFRELLEEHLPKEVDRIARYRGFGL
jgi:hypothetical protein